MLARRGKGVEMSIVMHAALRGSLADRSPRPAHAIVDIDPVLRCFAMLVSGLCLKLVRSCRVLAA